MACGRVTDQPKRIHADEQHIAPGHEQPVGLRIVRESNADRRDGGIGGEPGESVQQERAREPLDRSRHEEDEIDPACDDGLIRLRGPRGHRTVFESNGQRP